jgi:hypothetical protein
VLDRIWMEMTYASSSTCVDFLVERVLDIKCMREEKRRKNKKGEHTSVVE